MQIETKFHGTLKIEQEQTWAFPKGLPGFEEEKGFILLPIEGDEVFQVLQSTTSTHIAFIVTNPFTLIDDYVFEIDEPTIDLLKIQDQSDIFVLNVLSLKEPFETSTINLQAPLIFHTKNKQAKQMILNDTIYSMRHSINTKTKEEA
ncbi:flagellar assembly protein FliW [Sporosarcina ureilytica]|uniref:Flagellar assembly factor FliW n=1 Tax=Sporosarcina ureilytica TaxID=298596 RepID=A0A1D8JIJ2_9BACL|nr:flagellar assembly protein FliW [Sporosarcina ureilytica]AOV08513.1 flagellar assembly protein FliW [Sporosarcina ureilytica]